MGERKWPQKATEGPLQTLEPRLLTAEGTLDGAQRGPSAGARLERRPPKRTRDQHNRERCDNDKLPRRTIVPRDYLGAGRARQISGARHGCNSLASANTLHTA